jgi:hypothetical protein
VLIKQQLKADDLLDYLNGTGDDTGRQLRVLAERWIQSGIHSDGVEEPKSRKLPEFLREAIRCSVNDPLTVHIMPDGALQGHFSFRLGLESAVLDDRARRECDERKGTYLFLLFLDGDNLRFRLAKCLRKGCAAPYFFRERLRPIYKNGAVCPHHRKQVGSLRAREDERDDLLKLAAKFWPRWTPTKQPNRSLWTAGQVNAQRTGIEKHITQKWISRNAVQIEAEVERRNHAKG